MSLPRKPGAIRAGDLVQHRTRDLDPRIVANVYWTPDGDDLTLFVGEAIVGPYPARNYEVIRRVQPSADTVSGKPQKG